jgi:arylsulfatase A-like enzyme
MLSEHDIMFNHHGIWDEVVRVPLILRLPDGRHGGMRVAAQVRLMDVANTLLAAVRMDPMEGTESANLLRHAEGTLDRDLGTLLMGRVSASLSEGTLYGYRAALSGSAQTGQNLKYIWWPDQDQQFLFDLVNDPAEAMDIGDTQTEALSQMRGQVEQELGSLKTDGMATGLAPGDREALRALGYVE